MVKEKWWKSSVVYQIYPRSFCDSNGDGIGDINGIRNKLWYLKKLGIDVIWLSPVYASPNADNGYDISDYYGISPEYGSMEDMKALIRECENCGFRFTTFERVERSPLLVVKNDGTREAFNRDKILHGVMMAAQKRPISSEQLDALVDHVENEIRKQGLNEISSKDIGNLVMKELANLDDVAYIRFASIYRQFKDVSGFMEAMEDMMAKHDKE